MVARRDGRLLRLPPCFETYVEVPADGVDAGSVVPVLLVEQTFQSAADPLRISVGRRVAMT